MDATVRVSKTEYDELVKKASLFDHFIETEELTKTELAQVKKAMQGKKLSKASFLRRYPDLK